MKRIPNRKTPALDHALGMFETIAAECNVEARIAECRRLDDREANKVQSRGLRFSPLWTRPMIRRNGRIDR